MSRKMGQNVSLYDAKTRLSGLVDQAAADEEIVISKNGIPQAKLVPIPFQGKLRKPANAMKISHIAADFDAVDDEITGLFEGSIVGFVAGYTCVFMVGQQASGVEQSGVSSD